MSKLRLGCARELAGAQRRWISLLWIKRLERLGSITTAVSSKSYIHMYIRPAVRVFRVGLEMPSDILESETLPRGFPKAGG
jgi:hypothetical protein